MIMATLVYRQPIGRLMAQADRLDPNVGSHLAICCIHCINWANSRNALSMMTAP